MAILGSPGVSVSVIDESFYTPNAPGSVPLIIVATAQDKQNGSGTGAAAGTTKANAGTVYVITSQRDLTDTFGVPKFYTDTNKNPINGSELNEYGLQAAYSALGISSRAYILRADVNLTALNAATSIPTGKPGAGTYWIDTVNSLFGINEWDSTTQKFTLKTPLIVNDTNVNTDSTSGVPKSSFGKIGDYAVYVTKDNANSYPNAVFYKNSSNVWVAVSTQAGNQWSGGTKKLQVSPHYQYPTFTGSTPTGSIWIKTTTPGYGANVVVKYYNATAQTWGTVSAPIYNSTLQAIHTLDPLGGGKGIAVGTLFVESDPDHYGISTSGVQVTTEFRAWRRANAGATSITSQPSVTTAGGTTTFSVRETLPNGTWGPTKTVSIASGVIAEHLPAALSAQNLNNVSAVYDAVNKTVTITHATGGDFELTDGTGSPLAALGFSAYDMATKSGTANLYSAPSADSFGLIATNWKPLVYQSQSSAPVTTPADGTVWYDANLETVDILYNNGTTWVGYKDNTAFPNSNPTGPIVSATEPTQQIDGSDLVAGDIWINVSDVETYGEQVYIWNANTLMWDLQDVTDHHTPNGWIFADARWGKAGSDVAPATIEELLASNYLDPDAPDPALYPKGTRLWNLRRSGFSIKEYMTGYINVNADNGLNIRFGNDNMSGYNPDRWVTISPRQSNDVGTFGRHAQRAYVVSKLKAMIDTNQAIRDTDTLNFNLIACPGYPEVISNLVALNTDVKQTAFVVGDTPFRLEPTGQALTAWGNNTAKATDNGDKGAVTYDPYMAMFYPSGYTTDNLGNNIVVPPSHMMLRTIINSDAKSYPWFAPAGTRRGGVDNATSVGYINSLGEFKPASLYEGIRDAMATVHINPISTLPGIGIVNFGQYTRQSAASSLDRINVARLVAHLRRQLAILSKPYLFEPNDAQTRNEIKAAAESLLLELVGQRALYDFIVVCDTTNNTPARIDRSELWLDIAIEPVKAVEFIYIPLRLLNTGAIASGNLGQGFPGSNK
jgi:hypothetical protein